MIEILQNFEQIAAKLSSIASVGLGLAAVLAGLLIWLGGLGFRKLLPAIAGAVGGGILGFFTTGKYTLTGLISAAACIVAIIYERVFFTILAACLAAVLGFAILADPYIEQASSLKDVCLQMPVQSWAIIAGLAILFIIAGIFVWRLTSALCCAVLGTLLIFAGMILLLLNKGTTPASSISQKPLLYASVLAGMTAFGTIVQLLFCQSAAEKPIRKKQTDKDKQESENESMRWRNR